MTETTMTLQTFSPALLAPAREAHSPSFWRRLLDAIMEGRQRKADAYMADYLARYSGDYHDQLGAAFERRRRQRSKDADRIIRSDDAAAAIDI
jgi:DNA-binding FadR family transcriptional regulator